jgi:hypothetical protein
LVKKRGNRRTGSARVARASEAAFFASLLAVGALGLWIVLSRWVVPHWQVDHDFVETTCTLVSKRLDHLDKQLPVNDQSPARAEFTIEYEWQGRQHLVPTYNATRDYSSDRPAVEQILARYEVGRQYPCWFAPRDPDRVVLERGGHAWVWLLPLIPIPFLTLGAGGLIYTILHWRRSTEHRSILAQKNPLNHLESSSAAPPPPTVPDAGNLTNSPGTHLAFRLPVAAVASWRLFGAILFCALAAVVTIVCAWIAIAHHMRGDADWWLDLFVLPLAGVTAWAATMVARQWAISSAVGPTMVEIADHPLAPGCSSEVLVLQSGRLDMDWLEVCVECVEQASYQQGTDVRTETATVWREVLLRCERFHVDYDVPFQRKCLVTIPRQAMHSFASGSNEIRWTLVVRGAPVAWPEFERRFPLVVYPAALAKSLAPEALSAASQPGAVPPLALHGAGVDGMGLTATSATERVA